MKKLLLLILFSSISQSIEANWITSMKEAQEIALVSNKLIIIDFWAKWCVPCKKMDLESWNHPEVETVLQNYIKLKIDIDFNRELALKYAIKSIPQMIVIDGNGTVIYRFSGYKKPLQLKNELLKFSLSTEYIGVELVNFYKNQNFNSAIRLSQKYLNYSLVVNQEIKKEIIFASNQYLEEAKDQLKKSENNYSEKKQKLELLSLYEIAYDFDFEKLEKKVILLNPEKISESNQYQYWFLKLLALKGNKKSTSETEAFLKTHDLENVIENSNQLYGFYEKTIKL